MLEANKDSDVNFTSTCRRSATAVYCTSIWSERPYRSHTFKSFWNEHTVYHWVLVLFELKFWKSWTHLTPIFHQIKTNTNPFDASSFFLYPLKTCKKLWFCDVSRSYRKRPVAWNWSDPPLIIKLIYFFKTTVLFVAKTLWLSLKFVQNYFSKYFFSRDPGVAWHHHLVHEVETWSKILTSKKLWVLMSPNFLFL